METSAGRADRVKQSARSAGWFTVRPAEKRNRQTAAPDASFPNKQSISRLKKWTISAKK
ncbi:hypothetical protein NLX67_02050 [Domibacillus sp. A3M-37]|uniref:hypothetical protein n=1 Tax=Domibacillus sp. A3M-37 TaxID=2962037 RepID=UPI0020B7920E|nr:hypothetical protein [Domibacillus sp. A3M-37]MCP3761175.1 hypothetical protein [Domibacillus sp. A3M-37]